MDVPVPSLGKAVSPTTDGIRIDLKFQPRSKKSMLTIKPNFVIRMIIVSV